MDSTPIEIDLQVVVQRLATQVGQQAAELATAQAAMEAQAKVIFELTSRLPPEDDKQ
jgi:hypothetical protein